MRHKNSIDIFNYWDQIRGQFDAPLRSQVDPAAVRHILPHLFILENTKTDTPRFRLAGTAICSLFGRELREEGFASIWGDVPAYAVTIAKAVMTDAVPALIGTTGYTASDRHLNFELVMMPIRSSGETCDRLLGCLTPVSATNELGAESLEYLVLDRSSLLTDRSTIPTESIEQPKATRSFTVGKSGDLGGTVRRMLHLKIFDGGRAR
jgi:hypothetical protein